MFIKIKDSEYLIKMLVLPLAIFSFMLLLVSFFIFNLNFYSTLQDFMLNLGVTFIGIIITVSYVNWILNKHENKKWLDVQVNIHYRIKKFLEGTISTFRLNFGFGLEVFPPNFFDKYDMIKEGMGLYKYTDNQKEIFKEVINVGENVIKPEIGSKIRSMDQKQWILFAKYFVEGQERLIRIIDLFGNKIEPELFSDLLLLEDSINVYLEFYGAFPDFFGVPDSNIPPKALKHKKELYDNMKLSITNILSVTLRLMKKMKNIE